MIQLEIEQCKNYSAPEMNNGILISHHSNGGVTNCSFVLSSLIMRNAIKYFLSSLKKHNGQLAELLTACSFCHYVNEKCLYIC